MFEQAGNGDAVAKEIVDGTAKALALLCVQLANMTDPQSIVFAGGMIAAGDLLLNQIRLFYKQYIGHLFNRGSLELCYGTLGEDVGIIGASSLAIERT